MEYIDANTYNATASQNLAVVLGEWKPTSLERRWARFFDLLQIPWTSGWPLPFWLPFDGGWEYPGGFPNVKGLWVGVSEFPPSDEMRQIFREVAHKSGHWVHLLVGEPQPGFEVYSWRKSHRLDIDGQYGVADLELTWENFDNFSCFDIDFSFNTVPGTSRNVRNAFLAMQLESVP
jgi:hypothetical protein